MACVLSQCANAGTLWVNTANSSYFNNSSCTGGSLMFTGNCIAATGCMGSGFCVDDTPLTFYTNSGCTTPCAMTPEIPPQIIPIFVLALFAMLGAMHMFYFGRSGNQGKKH